LHFANMSFCHHAIWQAGLFAKETLYKLVFGQHDVIANMSFLSALHSVC
jgi:hypothetical protein